MTDHIAEDGSFINSIVGEGTRFRGELDLSGLLRIDGDYSGTIRTPGKVLVGKNGRAECTIYAGTVVIGGVVKGNVFSEEKVIVLSTGMIIGNVTTPRLIVEEGVILNGQCRITKESEIKAVVRAQTGDLIPEEESEPSAPAEVASEEQEETEQEETAAFDRNEDRKEGEGTDASVENYPSRYEGDSTGKGGPLSDNPGSDEGLRRDGNRPGEEDQEKNPEPKEFSTWNR